MAFSFFGSTRHSIFEYCSANYDGSVIFWQLIWRVDLEKTKLLRCRFGSLGAEWVLGRLTRTNFPGGGQFLPSENFSFRKDALPPLVCAVFLLFLNSNRSEYSYFRVGFLLRAFWMVLFAAPHVPLEEKKKILESRLNKTVSPTKISADFYVGPFGAKWLESLPFMCKSGALFT